MIDPRLEDLFHRLLELPPDERRGAFDELAVTDPVLSTEAAELLDAFELQPAFLEPVRLAPAERPERIGRYPILRELGRGGMGVVYLAVDPDLGREVALKTLAPRIAGSAERREQLRAEARSLAAVAQPNVAQIFALEEDPNPPSPNSADAPPPRPIVFLTMEYVPGQSLADRIAEGSLALEECLDLTRQIAAGLEAAHARGIVHRDLKPQNVRVTPDGWAKVLDFGLAVAPAREGSANEICGTLGYMSPEQAKGQSLLDRSDVWSFGCLLFECLSGSPAIAGESAQSVLEATRAGEVLWSQLPDNIPARLVDLVRRCLELDPPARPSAGQVRRFLDEELLRLRARSLQATGTDTSRDAPTVEIHLPARASAFVGRERVLIDLLRLLADHRVVTICGPGGCGKTRLAVEAARQRAGLYADGVWFLDLTALTPQESIAAFTARALGIRDVARDAGPEDGVERALASKNLLLVFDNCEHVVDAAATWVARLSAACASVSILATSRESLDLFDEQVFDLPLLDVAPEAAGAGECRQSEALQLFESRARSRRPGFLPSEPQIIAIAEICRRLDGLPLAIELAASHARSLSVEEILERVRERPLEVGQARGLAGRHQSLLGLIEWSVRLLSEEEARLFARLSVFRGGWTLASAEEVCAGEGLERWAICDSLSRLVERSLVEVFAQPSTDEPRYRFLETIRQYADERLVAEGAAERFEARLIEFCVATSALEPNATPQQSEEKLRWIAAEYANLTSGLEIALRTHEIARAVQLGAALSRHWLLAGLWREGRAWLLRILDAHEAHTSAGTELDPAVLPKLLEVIGVASRLSSQLELHDGARALAENAARIASRTGSRRDAARAAHFGGLAAHAALLFEEAEHFFRAAVDGFRGVGDRTSLASAIGNLASSTLGRSGDPRLPDVLSLYHEHLRLARELGDDRAAATVLNNLGLVATLTGRFDEARVHLEESLALFRALGDALGATISLHTLGDGAIELGDYPRSRACLLEAMNTRHRIGQRVGVSSSLRSISRLVDREGDPELAAEILGSVLAARDSGGLHLQEGEKLRMDQWRGQLESRLGRDTLEQALARGAARSLDQAVAWVNSVLDPSRSASQP